MTQTIVHHQRLAWDCARAFTAVVEDDLGYHWLSGELRTVLGPDYELALSDSHARLRYSTRPDAMSAETGLWRARIEDALRQRPELAPALDALARDAGQRARPTWLSD
jgi:hypothetical protein